MWNRVCLRPASTRRLLVGLSLACWFVIFLVYFLLVKRSERVRAQPVAVEHAETLPLSRIFLAAPQLRLLSAYRDPRRNAVLLVAVGRVLPLPRLFCFTAASEFAVSTPQRAAVRSLLGREIHYDGLFIDCPLPISSPAPRFIAVSTNATGVLPSSFLRITEVPSSPPTSPTIGACVCPLHGNGSWVSARHLTSWIEMNRLLGVDHFVFYNYSAPSSLQPLFRHYTRLGVVQLLQWHPSPLPVAELGSWPPRLRQLHYFGQFVVFNECLLRMLRRYRFAMFADLDELLVPTQPLQTLPRLLTALGANATAFAFRGSYLRTDYEEEPRHHRIVFLRFARREVRVLDKDTAPKLILQPHLVRRMGIHDVLEAVGENRLRVLEPREALLMHYKSPPRYLRRKDAGVRDERVLRFRQQLLQRVERTLQQMAASPIEQRSVADDP